MPTDPQLGLIYPDFARCLRGVALPTIVRAFPALQDSSIGSSPYGNPKLVKDRENKKDDDPGPQTQEPKRLTTLAPQTQEFGVTSHVQGGTENSALVAVVSHHSR